MRGFTFAGDSEVPTTLEIPETTLSSIDLTVKEQLI